MKLHADLSQRAVVHSNQLNWVDSPSAGVQRRMLERDGEEVARATSIVRYAPGSQFSAHTHDGGEEFLVLEGIFSDEFGDYKPGTYVRNPVGSRHTPSSQAGCIILVKLWQMQPHDQQRVVIRTTETDWVAGSVSGMQVMPLHQYGSEKVALIRWNPGVTVSSGDPGGEEIFVLQGSFTNEFGTYSPGTWLRHPPGTHTCFSQEGCLMYMKQGHLNLTDESGQLRQSEGSQIASLKSPK